VVNGLVTNIVGETAALGASCLWTISSIVFTSAGKKIGPPSVNAYRTMIAAGFLVLSHALFLGTMLPVATDGQWLWMGISGIVGLGIGDSGLFGAFVLIGPRRSVLVMALSPIFASIGAYLMLGETIPTLGVVGVITTMTGVVLAVVEERERSGEEHVSRKTEYYGAFLALIGAIGQGIGLVFAKKGINLEPSATLDPLSATLMRMILGALFVWIIMIAIGKLPELREAIYNREGLSHTAAGAFVGPFMGVTLSMIAVTYTQTGIAQTLMSLMPVLIIPIVWVLYKQRTSWRGILGAVVAVIGVSILFLT
jgi:drug/metabolite transporter (DMT)-like permease